MKTLMLRVSYLGLAVSTILAGPGAKEQANADVPDPVADVLKPLQIADVDDPADADVPAPLAANTNAPAKPPVMVQEPTPPPNLKLSPALAEVVKLVQAGVTSDVLMAYITNSPAVFHIDSDAIVYLNDLGVTNTVITALIQHDSSPEAAARKAAATAVQPLPPGVAATAPVTNVYPINAAATRSLPPAGQTTYPGDFSMIDTNAPPPPTDLQPAVETAAPTENVTVNNFYSSLAPYGTWMDVDGYGLCWRPTVAVHDPYWRPYSHRGRWLWSDCGWYWYSDYSWGWAPFHYGRWCNYPSYGWLWVPGTVWGPSWVTWSYSGSYCGWAPLPPGCGYRSGFGLTWHGSSVAVGFGFGLGWNCYTYVPVSRFCDWNVSRHCLPEHNLRVVHRTATPVNKFTSRNNNIVNEGVEPNTIAKASRTKIPTMRIKDAPLPVGQGVKPERLENNGNAVAVVRPQLPKNAPAAAPAVSRGTATRGKPVNMAPAAGQQASTPSAAQPRPNLRPPQATANPGTSTARDSGTARRHEPVAVTPQQNPGAANRTPPAHPFARQQVTTPNASRQTTPSAAAPAARNNTPASAPVARNNTPAPAPRNQAPAVRSTPPAQNQQPRSAPQTAPRLNNNNNMIRSFAQPQQRSAPAPSAHPFARPQASAPAARPQFSAPASRPSVAPSAPRSAPPAARSAPSTGGGGGRAVPSSGGGGGGGGRSSGNGNAGTFGGRGR